MDCDRVALATLLFLLPPSPTLPLPPSPPPLSHSTCPSQLENLIPILLRDLPSYANRVSQRSRRGDRSTDVYGYVLLAGRPEFIPLTLGPGEYRQSPPISDGAAPRQVFITTLERQYVGNQAVHLQHYHWLFVVQTSSGWQLTMMFSQIGSYPTRRPPTPPRDSSQGVVAQAIQLWLRDCQAGRIRQ